MTELERAEVHIQSVVNDGLGHSSYVLGLGDGTALVIDPARFPDQQCRIVAERGWRLAWTADTHSHADYISGSVELAAEGATFLASRGARLEMPHRPVDGGDELQLAAGVALQAIATPGHTPDHLAYLLVVDGAPHALFSGGSLLVGAVGRTDLLGDEQREELARAMFQALRAEILTLPDDLAVYPTHGAGSFCSAPSGSARTTTIGIERATNPLLRIDDEDRFVATLLDGLGSFPTYFRQLPEINRRGPHVYPQLPELPRLDLDAVRRHVAQGAALVDARPIGAFAAGHVPGSLSVQHRSVFASWFGWLVPLDRPVVFILDAATDRSDLVRQCLAIGHDTVLGELDGGIDAWTAAGLPLEGIPLITADAVAGTVLDIRQDNEWDAGHLPGAVHIELGSLAEATVPAGPLTVMCGHGERAMSGASLLTFAGHREVSVLAGGPDDWRAATGVELETA
jgi:glyoxylase-like metal-dependent hydrolase (beta-lactamase superfamily II)/rhodanese-related sulfurtransferase